MIIRLCSLSSIRHLNQNDFWTFFFSIVKVFEQFFEFETFVFFTKKKWNQNI